MYNLFLFFLKKKKEIEFILNIWSLIIIIEIYDLVLIIRKFNSYIFNMIWLMYRNLNEFFVFKYIYVSIYLICDE